ncbi:MAG: ribose 1,5-bisphosphokinase [Desulfonauticus sp.]|nr:ribose 1,5-bisphosphokinase [Desulfonauticus sp.]
MNTKIFLVTGPSGAGKDTLIKLAKEYLKDNKEIIFLKRYITRKPDKNEENYYLSREAFFILEKSGFFFTTWKAYNNLYGISFNEICLKNKKVIISISRKKVSCFERKFNYVHTLYITESVEKIEERLNMRKREPDDMIKKRLSRYNIMPDTNNITFIYNTNLDKSLKKFLDILKR